MNRAVFLDRDGVINRKAPGNGYITRWEEMHFLPGAAKAVTLLNQAGFCVIVVTNQRCVAKGLVTAQDMESIHRQMCEALTHAGATVKAVYFCPHEPQPPCTCRKPHPGLLLEAAREYDIDLTASWMIGDSDVDVEAGRNAGCRTARIMDSQATNGNADVVAPSLLEAIHRVLRLEEVFAHRLSSAMNDLKQMTIRGGLAKACAQAATFFLRIGSLMVLARILEPKDFGLVGMVTAVIGVLNLFRDFGLSTAAVQRATVTHEQISTLFWINMLVGLILGILSLAIAPAVVLFYHEPRLFGVTAVLAAGFLFNAAGVQHSTLLQRQMRFTTLAGIDIASLVISIAVGIGMAIRGYGYWALVGMTVISPLVSSICMWLCAAWVPGIPRKEVGIRSMVRFGGTMTLSGLVVYIAYNLEKVLLGRFWGVEAIGIYGRAYQLINLPTDNLNSAVGGVAFSALSRLQHDPLRFKSYFLKGYSLILVLTIPITIVCALFAHDLILVALGPKWKDVAPLFRLLAPTTLIFALINPLAWLIFSIGLVGRSLKVALVLAPLVIAGYVMGLPYGPKGVAFGYSAVMTLWVIPHIAWCVHGTMISFRDILLAVSRPLLSGIVAAAFVYGLQFFYGTLLSPLPRLALGLTLLLGTYLGILLRVMGQKPFYLDLLRGLRRPLVEEEILVSA